MGINSYTVVNLIAAAAAKQYVVAGPINFQAGTAVPLSATPQKVTQLEIYGYKSIGTNTIPVPNTSAGWAGVGANGLTDTIAAGGKVLLKPFGGTSFDLSNVYVLGSAGDSVYIKYLQ